MGQELIIKQWNDLSAWQVKNQQAFGERLGLDPSLPAEHKQLVKWCRTMMTLLRKTPKLWAVERQSLTESVYRAAELGLSLDGVLGEAYLIPYGKRAQLQLGYRGALKLALVTGFVHSVHSAVVYEGDQLVVNLGVPSLDHFPDITNQQREWSPVTHVYAKAHLHNGSDVVELQTKSWVERHKEQYARDWRSADSPWQTAWEAMARKTLLIKLCKQLPAGQDAALAAVAFEEDIPPPAEPLVPMTARQLLTTEEPARHEEEPKPAKAKTAKPADSPGTPQAPEERPAPVERTVV